MLDGSMAACMHSFGTDCSRFTHASAASTPIIVTEISDDQIIFKVFRAQLHWSMMAMMAML